MTYEEVFNAAKAEFMKADVSKLTGHLAVQVDIVGEGAGAFYIELLNSKLYVEPYEYYDRDVKLIATAEDFLKIADGSLNSVFAYTTGKLKVEGDLGRAMELQNMIESIKKAEKKKKK
ncbi:SCP2 sterol-binding domain-containing protein [uncultured Ruminococcus sp.]|uniref:SCP2 sterol-binding domain-containing protein n=1 Tax=uncultured Ruminococcus sp. TaxID=165186 RepID=UPI00260B1CA3|nr:SCP2 sterol-binding domain-containing protein [uncultured Ruminococcus sp.]